MNVTITELSQNTLNALRNLARTNRQTLDEYARSILERETQNFSKQPELTNAEKIRVFDEWMGSLQPNTPVLSDEQISRESMYEEQTLRQL